ncbi:exported hypothetical protein [Candidatus Sulfopaludibacter sp. SbA3]|nr:exported hypothetical protein [Candidatus Sulfopaludibacter sp. SbA3]
MSTTAALAGRPIVSTAAAQTIHETGALLFSARLPALTFILTFIPFPPSGALRSGPKKRKFSLLGYAPIDLKVGQNTSVERKGLSGVPCRGQRNSLNCC